MIQKSYEENEFGKLYLVPTPIGNIEDITLRAIKILQEVDIIYAEDTRTSNILLKAYKINRRIKSYHKFNEEKVKESIIKELKDNKNIALISDRGTPLISDPGTIVVNEAIKNNIAVIALPGSSALLPALNMSGFNNEKFYFYGFLSGNENNIIKELESLKSIHVPIILYEAPHRLLKTLNHIYEVFGNISVVIAREISKIHEEVFRGSLEEAIIKYKTVRGEIVLIIEIKEIATEINKCINEVKELVNLGLSLKDSAKFVSNKYGVSKNLLYNSIKETNK